MAARPVDVLAVAAEIAVAAAICLTPLVFGGRGPYGAVTFQLTAIAAAILVAAAAIRSGQSIAFKAVDAVAAAFIGLVAFQLVPLPSSLLETLAPHHQELLPLWNGESLPQWSTITLAPRETMRQLGFLMCGWLLLVAARHVVARDGGTRRLAVVVAGLGLVMAAFALLQYFAGNGLYYWVYESPVQDTNNGTKGPFINTNHFAGFCVQTLPATLWLLLGGLDQRSERGRSVDRRRDWAIRGLAAASLLALLAAIAFSGSRAGLLGIGVAGGTWFLLHRGGKLSAAALVSGVMVLTLGAAAVLTLVGDSLESEIESNVQSLATTDIEQLDQRGGRRIIWGLTLEGIESTPIVGSGLGSHATYYRQFWTGTSTAKLYSHVENGPLQATLETGLVGASLLLVAIGLIGWAAARLIRQASPSEATNSQPLAAVPVAMLMANLVHAMSDFVWHTPGCMVLVLLAAAMVSTDRRAAKSGDGRSDSELRPARPGRCFASAVVLLAVIAAAGWAALPNTVASLRAERSWTRFIKAMQVSPRDNPEIHDLRLRAVRAAATANPGSAAILSRDARALLAAFDRKQQEQHKMELSAIREAVRAGGFESVEQVREWLLKDGVAGENIQLVAAARIQARRSLELLPLQPPLYTLLAKTNFLDVVSDDAEVDLPLLEQGLAVSPTESATHYELGLERMRLGNFEAAMEHWQAAFNNDHRYQRRITLYLAKYVPADQFLAAFKPDWAALQRIQRLYAISGRPEGEAVIVLAYARALEAHARELEPEQAAHCCLVAHNQYDRLGLSDEAVRLAEDCYRLRPNLPTSRQILGRTYFKAGRYDEALPHLKWIADQQPDNERLAVEVRRCLQYSLNPPVAAADQPTSR